MYLLCIRVSNNNETIRACGIFSQLLKIFSFREDERLQTNFAFGLVRAFPTSISKTSPSVSAGFPNARKLMNK